MSDTAETEFEKNEVLLSVIIPVYNTREYLERCIKTVLEQKNIGYEIILIDDGSTDGSGEMCDQFSKQYSCISAYHKKNGGVSGARNLGTSYAKGKYIYYLDSDDKMVPGFFENFEFRIDSDGDREIDVYVCQHLENGDAESVHIDLEDRMCCSGEAMLKALIETKKLFIIPPKYIVNRKFLAQKNILFYEGIVSEDELWVPQILLLASYACFFDVNAFDYIRREGSVSRTITDLKRGASNIRTSTEKWKLYHTLEFEDEEFKSRLMNSCVTIFLNGVISSYYGRCDKSERAFIKTNWDIAECRKTKEQNRLYRKAKYLYFRIFVLGRERAER